MDEAGGTQRPTVDGRPALHPIRLWQAVVHLTRDDGLVMAGHLTFIALVAMFPFLIFLTALAGFLGQTGAGTRFVAFMLANMPEQVALVLEAPILEVVQETSGSLLTVGIVAAIWTAASGLEAARTGLNRAYDIGYRPPIWRSRLESVALVIASSGIFLVAMLLVVFGPVAWSAAAAFADLPAELEDQWHLLRYAVSASISFFIVAGLYAVLPAARLQWRWIVPGAVVTVVLWLLAGSVFSIFVARVGSYTVTYGSLAGVVMALLFFFALAAIFLYGAEVNAAIARAERGLPERHKRFTHRRPKYVGRTPE
ncbi:MAG: YihY/virulence factor BrkB family protein [Alphaproteobacteria bacterium]